jgi:hypothetical protein
LASCPSLAKILKKFLKQNKEVKKMKDAEIEQVQSLLQVLLERYPKFKGFFFVALKVIEQTARLIGRETGEDPPSSYHFSLHLPHNQ